MSHVATFWLAEGVLLRNDIPVPSPPPFSYYIAIAPPVCLMLHGFTAAAPLYHTIHRAEFRLADASPTGEVAHYYLSAGPPAGWRWIAANGRLGMERA